MSPSGSGTASGRERAALAVIRVWIEPSPGDRLRARITLVRDLARPEPESDVTADRDELVAIVGRFVDDFLAGR